MIVNYKKLPGCQLAYDYRLNNGVLEHDDGWKGWKDGRLYKYLVDHDVKDGLMVLEHKYPRYFRYAGGYDTADYYRVEGPYIVYAVYANGTEHQLSDTTETEFVSPKYTEIKKPVKVEPAKPRFFRMKGEEGKPTSFSCSHHYRVDPDGKVFGVKDDGTEEKSWATLQYFRDGEISGHHLEVNAQSSESLLRSCKYASKYMDGKKKGHDEGYKSGYEQATKDMQKKMKDLVNEIRAFTARVNDRVSSDFNPA